MKKYNVVKYFAEKGRPCKIIKRSFTLEQAQAYCSDPKTRHHDQKDWTKSWFCGYEAN